MVQAYITSEFGKIIPITEKEERITIPRFVIHFVPLRLQSMGVIKISLKLKSKKIKDKE